jgi:hypothetical protein
MATVAVTACRFETTIAKGTFPATGGTPHHPDVVFAKISSDAEPRLANEHQTPNSNADSGARREVTARLAIGQGTPESRSFCRSSYSKRKRGQHERFLQDINRSHLHDLKTAANRPINDISGDSNSIQDRSRLLLEVLCIRDDYRR